MRTRFLSNPISCIILLLLLDLAFAFSANANLEVLQMQIKITSTVFKEGEFIPSKYTCDGKNIMPPLSWQGIPPETQSLVLIVDDPDAPSGTFTHAIFFDIDPKKESLSEGETPGVAGINDFGRLGYGGPCPPRGHGVHRYYFKVYALDIPSLKLKSGAYKSAVEKAMKGHILAYGELVGKYERM
jgi:Raf kinase inhibitor-like YbhB/YbcL family protein